MELHQAQDEQNQRYYNGLADDPELLARLVGHSLQNPTASAELNLALSQGGIAAGDPMANALVQAELESRDTLGAVDQANGGWWDGVAGVVGEWVVNPVQGAVRWGFASWDAAYQMVAGGAPIRAMRLADEENISFGEAWQQQDPYFFEALGAFFNDPIGHLTSTAEEPINLSSGFMPQSELAPGIEEAVNAGMRQIEQDTEGLAAQDRYRTRLEAAPGVWRDAIAQNAEAQAELGKPLTQLHDVDAESVIFEVTDIYGQKRYTPWSPARLATATIVEPGTRPFHAISGMGDFATQIFADPVEWMGLGLAKGARNARRVWAEGKKVADEVLTVDEVAQLALPQQAGMATADVTAVPTLPAPDPTRALAGDMGATVYNPRLEPPSHHVGEAAGPWWQSGVPEGRALRPTDPPAWYIEMANQVRRAAGSVLENVKPRRRMAGSYEIDLPRVPGARQQKIRIQRRGKGKKAYWEAVMPDGSRASLLPDDPRFSQARTQFRTLQEATDAALRAAGRWGDEATRIHGQTADEFVNSYEDFAVDDIYEVMNYSPERAEQGVLHRVQHSRSKPAKGKLANARVRVYGKTLDLSSAIADDLPKGLQDALRADGKLRGGRIVGFGNPKLDKFQNTMRWMEQNGYGKMRWDDDTVLFHDKFIGGTGDNLDPLARVFFEAADEPMWKYKYPESSLDDIDAPTPNEVNEIVDFVATSGGRYGEERPAREISRYVYGVDASTDGVRFWQGISETAQAHPYGQAVEVKDSAFYADSNNRLFMAGDGSAGAAVTPDGDLVSVYKKPGSDADIDEILSEAAQESTTLDGFDIGGFLPTKYSEHGFVPVARVRFNREYAPPGWDYAKLGEPDVVLMVRDPDGVLDIAKGDYNAIRESVPVFDDWDEAAELQAQYVARVGSKGDTIGRKGDGFAMPGMHPGVAGVSEEAVGRAKRIKEVAAEEARDPAIKGVRNDFDPDYTLHGKKVDMFLDQLTAVSEAGDAKSLDSLFRFFRRQGIKVPNEVRQGILDAGSKDEIASIMARWMVNEGVPDFILPGGMRYGKMATIGGGARMPATAWRDQHWFARRMAESLGRAENINVVDDPSGFYQFVLDALPHYNVSRGAKIAKYDPKTGEKLAGEIDIEEILSEIRNLPQGDKRQAFDMMGRLNQALFSSLVEDGVDPRLADHAARWFRDSGDKAVYDAERIGNIAVNNGPNDVTLVNGELLGGNGIQLTADMWGGALSLPDPRTLKRITNESDLVGQIANRIAAQRKVIREGTEERIAGELFEDRTWTRAANFTMNKVWKPFVLLRAAWTLRILIDDQFRMAADGYSMFNHPMRIFNYALSNPKDWRDAWTKGFVDVNGVRLNTKNIDNMNHANFFIESMMRSRDPSVGIGAAGFRQAEPIPAGHPRYVEGMVFETQRLNGSLMTKVLADSTAQNPVEDTVRWLMGQKPNAPDPAIELSNLAHLYRDTPDIAQRILQGDQKTLIDVVSRQYAILHHRLGGDVVLDNGAGQLLDFTTKRVVQEIAPTNQPKWIVRQNADAELLDIVAGKQPELFKLQEGQERLVDLEAILKRHVTADPAKFPNAVRIPKDISETGQTVDSLGRTLDKASGGLFDFFMTNPTNVLSRSPEFRRAYWERIVDFIPYASDELRADLLAKVPEGQKSALRKALKRAKREKVEGRYLTDMDQLDAHAKAYALTRIEQTLFNLTSKRNISDSLNLIFPFVEAWGEFISRWQRLLISGDRNIANLRRVQQGIEGARGSGFFYENDYGQEVFNYPAFMTKGHIAAHNALNNIPGVSSVLGDDISPEVGDAIQATGSVESLNFASGVIPGFGPVFQLMTKQFLPDDPEFDWIRKVVAPFGTGGGVVNQFAPAWVKRVISANGAVNDPALEYTYKSTLMDVMRTKIDRGDFQGVTDEADINRLVEEAKREAQGVLMVRAAATFWNPASPSYRFQKEDKTGMIWSYSNLGQEFRNMVQEVGDEAGAWDAFYERFGFLPAAFSGGKTYPVVNRGLSEAAWRFERGNPELFVKYPNTAMYVDPHIATESEYSHEAMLAQLERGLREQWTAEQFTYLQQDQLGDLWWDNANRTAQALPTEARKPYLAGIREQIETSYPYWNKQVPGKAQTARADEKRAEAMRMAEDPSLQSEPAIIALNQYLGHRQEVLDQLVANGATSIDGPKSTTTITGKIATRGREYLRDKAEELKVQYPEFGPLFDSIFRSEVGTYHDTPVPPTIDVNDEGDYFFDMGLAG